MAKVDKRKRWQDEKVEQCGKLVPMNQSQAEYIHAIRSNPTVISTGSAGTGKSYIAACIAAELYLKKQIRKIVLTRPVVAVGRTSGLLPGTLDEKLEPWFRPITDTLIEKLGKGVYDTARSHKNIEFAPFEMMQGRTFNDSFVVLDEAQNTTPFEMRMFLTRLGENTTTVINGDIKQKSLREDSGLAQVLRMIELYDMDVPVIEFTPDDIVRSAQCKAWIMAFERYEG